MKLTRRKLWSGIAVGVLALIAFRFDSEPSPEWTEGYHAAEDGKKSHANPHWPSLFNDDETEWRRGWIQYHVDQGFVANE